MYYGELFQLWFDNVTANTQQKGGDPLKINETFRNGAYYRWDLSDTLSVLSINTILSNFRDLQNDKAEKDQLEWIQAQLTGADKRKFII